MPSTGPGTIYAIALTMPLRRIAAMHSTYQCALWSFLTKIPTEQDPLNKQYQQLSNSTSQ